ncbi:hypothetical protein [Natrinema sp. 74]|uniref:hypothetical protein n=1 Tax=Natrinema sp. 74 TaxID=3384159 RepID=UPI0038D44D01
MRQHRSQQSTDTERMAESTMNQSRQAFEQLIDLQRNMAQMTLSAIRWQEIAQQQGLEMTKSMLENTPGPQFTESMMESYLQGMEEMMPEMEQVMEEGFEAAAQPQMAQMEQMESRMQEMGQQPGQMQETGQQPGRGRMSEHGMDQQPSTGRAGGQQFGDQQTESQAMTGPTSGQRPQTQPQPQAQTTGQGGPTGRSREQYPETGEWVSPGEYGGEPAGASGIERQPQSTDQFEDRSQQGGPDRSRQEPGRAPPTGSAERQREQAQPPQQSRSRQPQEMQPGTPARGGEQGGDRATQQQPPQPQSEQGRPPEGYSQRLDTDRRERSERGRPSPQGREHTGQSAARGPESERANERDRGERRRTDEMGEMEEVDISTEGTQQRPAGNRSEERNAERE